MSKARDLADSAQEINILDGKSFLDEDNLASDSATGIASQQSIKAYVDGITTTNITSTGALNSGSITSGFGNIDNGSSTITTTGAISGGSFVIGSADINENDLESIDGITAGTVSASKAVVVNTNKDITGFRNITATGTISGSLSGTLSGAIASTTTATTQAESDDSTKVATTEYVSNKITTLIGGAPSTLNDLNELAAAINDDANYNTTLTTALATKLPLAGGTMTGDVLYNNNVKAKFGAGSQLQIYSDGTHGIIKESGSGDLLIYGNNLRLGNADGSELYILGNNNAEVQLRYNNATKLATTSTGIQVTGNIANASGDLTLDVAGNIILDADGGLVRLYDGSAEYGRVLKNGNNLQLQSQINDGDLVFKGIDNNSTITALTLDMSEGGRANFSNDIGLNDDRGLRLGSGDDSVIYNDGSNLYIKNNTSNQDIIFQGNDDGSANTTALTLDMSDGGTAYFNHDIFLNQGGAKIRLGTSSDVLFLASGSNGIIDVSSGDLTFDVSGDITLDAGGTDIYLKTQGNSWGHFMTTSNNFYINSTISDGDIVFQGNDGGSTITALTLDMSSSGNAIFNNEVFLGDTKALTMGASNDFQIFHDGSGFNQIIAVNDHPIQIKTSSENMIKAIPNGGVELYHNNSKKIETTSTGIAVTGEAVLSGKVVTETLHRTGVNGSGIHFSTNATYPTNENGSVSDGTEDLGASGYRWRHGYFSGNLYGDGSNLTGVGGSTSFGAVGTYVWGKNSSLLNTGSTTSGSNIVASNGGGFNTNVNNYSMSGTWRIMGYNHGAYTSGSELSLYVRIS